MMFVSGQPLRFIRELSTKGPEASVLLTSSRRPSRRTRALLKDLELTIYSVVRLTRGHESLKDLNALAASNGLKRVVIIGEWKGNPGLLVAYSPSSSGLVEVGKLSIVGVTLRRELGSRATGSCRYVAFTGGILAKGVAEFLSESFQLKLVEKPTDNYVDVTLSEDGGVSIVARGREGKLLGPVLRVRPLAGCCEGST